MLYEKMIMAQVALDVYTGKNTIKKVKQAHSFKKHILNTLFCEASASYTFLFSKKNLCITCPCWSALHCFD